MLALVACADAETNYGDPNGIVGKRLPKETAPADPGTGEPTGTDPFEGTTPTAPSTTLEAAHTAATGKGAPAPADDLDCLSCHTSAGTAAAKPFAYGGHVKDSKPNVDVIVVVGTTKAGPVKTDDRGFFWLAGSPLAAGGKASVRSGSTVVSMNAALEAGSAASCGAQRCHGAVQLPVGNTL